MTMAKAIKPRTLEEAFDSSPDECVVEPQYEVELVELKGTKKARPAQPPAARATAAAE